jgi:hypothetical protein
MNRDLTATQHFLYSKTPAEGTHAPPRDTAPAATPSGADDPLRQHYPGLRCGKAYGVRAAEKGAAAALFTAIALRIDTAAYRHEDDRDRRQPLRLKVAQAIDKACAANNAWWGLMSSDIFGCVFPEKDVASALAIAKKLQEQVNATAELTLTIGLAAFPASLVAGVLWQGVGRWAGFGPSAPFLFGAGMALLAVVLLVIWLPDK